MSLTDLEKSKIERQLQNHVGKMITPNVRLDGFGAWKIASQPRVDFPSGDELDIYANTLALDGDDSREALEDVNGIEDTYTWLHGQGLMDGRFFPNIV